MDDLLKRFENLLWACCPNPDWKVKCDSGRCECCGKVIVGVLVSGPGIRRGRTLRMSYLKKVERAKKLEAFCRKQMKILSNMVEEEEYHSGEDD